MGIEDRVVDMKQVIKEVGMNEGDKKKKEETFILKKAQVLNYLRKYRRVWVKNDEGNWSSVNFHEKSWLETFPEEIRKRILGWAGPASNPNIFKG